MTETPGTAAPSAAALEELNEAVAVGFGAALGLRYSEATADRVRASFEAGPAHHQPNGIVHGGVYCSVIEGMASLGGSLWLGERGHVVGVNNNTDFIRAARDGALDVDAVPVHRGRTQQIWKVDITDAQGRLIAEGKVRLANITDTARIGR